MIAAPCHGLVAIEDADRQLSTSALCRERGGVGRSLARFPVQEDRTGGSVRRLVLERVVRDEDQLVADRGILEALATGVPRALVGHVDGGAPGPEQVGRGGSDRPEAIHRCVHVPIVRDRPGQVRTCSGRRNRGPDGAGVP